MPIIILHCQADCNTRQHQISPSYQGGVALLVVLLRPQVCLVGAGILLGHRAPGQVLGAPVLGVHADLLHRIHVLGPVCVVGVVAQLGLVSRLGGRGLVLDVALES